MIVETSLQLFESLFAPVARHYVLCHVDDIIRSKASGRVDRQIDFIGCSRD
jgi:hypothetical protein